ncbi:MAG: RtcB family protein [Flavitalea sp.]
MGNLKPKELSKLGFTDNITRSLIINIISKHFKHQSNNELTSILSALRTDPSAYRDDALLGPIAESMIDEEIHTEFKSFDLLTESGLLKVYGGKHIEHSAKAQMEIAMSLPIAAQGALMPDAHTGFGVPIGGVLATTDAVVPYAVGVDIGCRMALSIIGESDSLFKKYSYQMKQLLREYTHFGTEGSLDHEREHAVLDRPEFALTELLRSLHGKAAKQLGSSGGGNHFVEFGVVDLYEENLFDLPPGKYAGLLTHSGSRGLGAAVAMHYTDIAMDVCRLPRHAKQLAWLDMNSEEGLEYWMSMNLAGDYAEACHETIHHHLLKQLGVDAIASVSNHHNFAWKEKLADGRDVIVHRKGATPAHKDQPGIIPGSMTTPGYIVRGKGQALSLNSAAHGAGRAMSRKRAAESMTVSAMKKILAAADVTLIGGTVEENPHAYKDIETVMASQVDLVDVVGSFMPRIVRMNKE